VIGAIRSAHKGRRPSLIRDFVDAMSGCPVGSYQVSPHMRDAFREAGFKDIQIGKEAIFHLKPVLACRGTNGNLFVPRPIKPGERELS